MIPVTQFALMSLGAKEVGLKIKVRSTTLVLLHTLSQSCSPISMFMLMFSNNDAHAPPSKESEIFGSSALVFLRDGISNTGYWNNPWLHTVSDAPRISVDLRPSPPP
jgi:hypothetical protein